MHDRSDTQPSGSLAAGHQRMFIAGELVEAASKERLEVVDPASEKVIGTCAKGGVVDADRAIEAAREAFDRGPWRETSGSERAALLLDVGRRLRARVDEFARVETLQQGNLIGDFEDETAGAAGKFEYCAGQARGRGGQALQYDGGLCSGVTRQPVGVVAAITPWNYPLTIIVAKIATALAAGNVVIAKPASITPLTTMMLGELFRDAGLPEGVLQIVTGPGGEVGERLAASDKVDMVSLTGSVEVGQAIGRAAADSMKRLVLELGGKSANIVFADCDFEAAIQGSMLAAFTNAGQVCTAGTRLLIERPLHDRFVDELAKRASALRVGPGIERDSEMGPLVSSDQLATVESYVEKGIAEGATLVCGGHRVAGRKGYFFEPTVFTEVTSEMTIAREEIFGPVISVIPFETEEEALQIANDSDYGLASGLWTTDLAKALRVSNRLEAGTVWVNTWFASHGNVAEGGWKLSGVGVEGGEPGLDEYTLVKHVAIDMCGEPCGVFPAKD